MHRGFCAIGWPVLHNVPQAELEEVRLDLDLCCWPAIELAVVQSLGLVRPGIGTRTATMFAAWSE